MFWNDNYGACKISVMVVVSDIRSKGSSSYLNNYYHGPSPDTYSTIYIGTFRAITSDWRKHKHSIGTQRVILNIICDVAIRFRGFFLTAITQITSSMSF